MSHGESHNKTLAIPKRGRDIRHLEIEISSRDSSTNATDSAQNSAYAAFGAGTGTDLRRHLASRPRILQQNCAPEDSRSGPRFVSASTLQPPLPNFHGPMVHVDLVRVDDHLTTKTLQQLVEELQTATEEDIIGQIQRVVRLKHLPGLVKDRNWLVLAELLTEEKLQRDVLSCLETLLLEVQKRNDEALKRGLLEVARVSWRALCELRESSESADHLLNVHLMAVAALLTRCTRPQYSQCAQFAEGATRGGQEARTGLKQSAFRALRVFYEDFRTNLEDSVVCPDWTNLNVERQKSLFCSSSFCQRILHAYTLLNELATEGWRPAGEALIGGLRELHESVMSNTGTSPSLCGDCKTAFASLVLRGLLVLLRTTYKEGTWKNNQAFLVASLTMDILQKADSRLKAEVGDLVFHDAVDKEEMFSVLLYGEKHLSDYPIQHFMEQQLRALRFRMQNRQSLQNQQPEKKKRDKDGCQWRKKKNCHVGNTHVEVTVYERQAECLHKFSLAECLDQYKCARKAKPEPPDCVPTHGGAFGKTIPATGEQNKDCLGDEVENRLRQRQNLTLLTQLSWESVYIIQLLAYQIKPFPFYITETVEGRRLLYYLLDHRQAEKWVDTHRLLLIAYNVVRALLCLEGRRLICRDVTTYNLLVHSPVQTQRSSMTKRCEVLTSPGVLVKLIDLGLTHEYMGRDPLYNDPVTVFEPGDIPVLWTAPEALFAGHYTEKSVVYNLGCIMFELMTHGCWPFTSYISSMSTEEFLRVMMRDPRGVRLHHWPCIPVGVFDLIVRFTDREPARRPTLGEAEKMLEEACNREKSTHTAKPVFEAALGQDKKYPTVSQAQREKNYIPERGIPASVKQLIAADPSVVYTNACLDQSLYYPSKHSKVTDEELFCSDRIKVEQQESRTVVKEILSRDPCRDVVRDVLPYLEASKPPHVTCWVSRWTTEPHIYDVYDKDPVYDRPHRLRTQDGVTINERYYEKLTELTTAAKRGLLWSLPKTRSSDTEDSDAVNQRALYVFHSLTLAVEELHERHFCHCDIRASGILVNMHNGEVVLARIGRIHRMPSDEPVSVNLSTMENSYRWLAPEVLLGGHYGPQSDVFMLATTIWEVFWIREKFAADPGARDRHLAPCTNIEKDEVLHFVCEGRPLPKPRLCPRWLYELILRGRSPEPTQRPTCAALAEQLEHHMTAEFPFLSHVSEENNSNATPTVPLPPRRTPPEPLPPKPTSAVRSLPSPPRAVLRHAVLQKRQQRINFEHISNFTAPSATAHGETGISSRTRQTARSKERETLVKQPYHEDDSDETYSDIMPEADQLHVDHLWSQPERLIQGKPIMTGLLPDADRRGNLFRPKIPNSSQNSRSLGQRNRRRISKSLVDLSDITREERDANCLVIPPPDYDTESVSSSGYLHPTLPLRRSSTSVTFVPSSHSSDSCTYESLDSPPLSDDLQLRPKKGPIQKLRRFLRL